MEVKQAKIQDDITDIINKMWEEYELTPNNVVDYRKPDNVALTQRKVKKKMKNKLKILQNRIQKVKK